MSSPVDFSGQIGFLRAPREDGCSFQQHRDITIRHGYCYNNHINYNFHTFIPWRVIRFSLQLVGLLLFSLASAGATESVTLVWDQNPEPDIAGYRVYYGSSSNTYTNQIDVGNAITTTVANLETGSTYFFAVTAYNLAGAESLPSHEIMFPAPPKRLSNVSTRALVQTGDKVAIGGFIIKDGEKRVILRALGPSLTALGVTGALADPVLDLYDSTGTLIASNDNWRSSQQTEIQQTGLAPTNDNESALIRSLPQGAYTAILRGANNTTGITLVEVFDLEPQGSSRITNLSTRADVEIDDNVMISGFIIGGNQPSKVLIRAIGPSLIQYGVSGVLLDPTIELHDQNGSLIFQNDDWRTDQEQQILDSNLAPSDDKESAIIATLQPASYTAIVRGKNNSTGVALVELYSLDQ